MTAERLPTPPDALSRLWQRVLRQRRFRLESACGTVCREVDQLDAGIAALAHCWQAAGARPGQVLMLRAAQGLPAFLSFWAAQRLGLVWLTVDPAWPAARLATLAATAGAVWWLDAEALADGDSGIPAPTMLAALPFMADGSGPPAAAAADRRPAWPGTAIAALLPTSGSTGTPKLVGLSRAALARSALLAMRCFGWQPGERLLNLAEPHTMSGLRHALLAAPLAGMCWQMSPPASRPDVFALFEQIRARRPQRLVAAPLLVRQANLWRSRLPADTWTGVRALYCTGADLDPAEVQRFHAGTGIAVVNYYGLTETVGLCLSQSLDGWDAQDRSLGRPVGCRVRLLDEAGRPLADAAGGDRPDGDPVGELHVRQRRPASGYWRGTAALAPLVDAEGWLATGDLARLDARGRVHLVGRRAHFIKTSGTEKVAPAEVEQALESHPEVLEAAVLGLRTGTGVERIAALVVLRRTDAAGEADTALQAALIAHVADRLGGARAPSLIRFTIHLPRAANGKLLRPQLPTLLEA
jgi:acyl-coenzyme A synthetase/AMP-(fatty) acid ligase